MCNIYTHKMIIIISYIMVYIIGFYIGCQPSYISLFRSYDTKTINNISNKTSFVDIGRKYKTDKIDLHHYDRIYEKYLPKYIGTNVSLLEIGLGCRMKYGPGASAYLWRNYLGPHADIHFIEYDRLCAEEWYKVHGYKLNVTMHYGSQEDAVFLNTITNSRGYFDIIIDDGGHTMKQQITSFNHLLSKVRSGGIYVIEDLQTSYSRGADSGYLVKTSAIEFIKRLLDDIQTFSPKKSTPWGNKLFSFEISNKICVFNLK